MNVGEAAFYGIHRGIQTLFVVALVVLATGLFIPGVRGSLDGWIPMVVGWAILVGVVAAARSYFDSREESP